MSTEEALRLLAKVRADTLRELRECNRRGSPDMVAAIETLATAMVERIEALAGRIEGDTPTPESE